MLLGTIVKDIIRLFFLDRHRIDRIGAIFVCIAATATTAVAYINSIHPEIVKLEIDAKSYSDELEPLNIVQLTDLHITTATPKWWLGGVVKRTNALNPDIVVITGDVADFKLSKHKKLLNELRNIDAPYGKFYIDGNHEYYENDVNEWRATMRSLGFTPLVNSNQIIEYNGAFVLIGGVSDPTSAYFNQEQPDPYKAAKSSIGSDIKILLSHQPNIIEDATKAGFDLQLSGHTHGGQFFPFTLVVDMIQDYFKGIYKVGNTWLYVSSGTGTWGPQLRLGSRTEITEISVR